MAIAIPIMHITVDDTVRNSRHLSMSSSFLSTTLKSLIFTVLHLCCIMSIRKALAKAADAESEGVVCERNCPCRLMVRTLPFQGSNPGSNPGGDAEKTKSP